MNTFNTVIIIIMSQKHEQYYNIVQKHEQYYNIGFERYDDIVDDLYNRYKNLYKCTSIKNRSWYEFITHRWVKIDHDYILVNKFIEMSSPEILEKYKHIHKYIIFKSSLLSAILKRFYDPDFEEKLDSNTYLIGFNNGIYDLKNKCFRPGSPDDYVSLSVGYDYIEYSKNDSVIKEIGLFFEKAQPDEETRKYILMLISSYLEGTIKYKKMIFWIEKKVDIIKSDIRDIVINLIEKTLGDYISLLPLDLLYNRGSSGAHPELVERGKRLIVFKQMNDKKDNIEYFSFGNFIRINDDHYLKPYIKKQKNNPQFQFLVINDEIPHIPMGAYSVWNRLQLCLWESTIENNNFKLEEYHRACFMWLLLNVYYPEYSNSGLHKPKQIVKLINNYRESKSEIKEFFKSDKFTINMNDNNFEILTDVYISFRNWYIEIYNDVLLSRKSFVNYLINYGYKIENGKIYGIKFNS